MVKLSLDNIISKDDYKKIIFGIDGRGLHVLWDDIKSLIQKDFESRKNIFLYCLQELLNYGTLVEGDLIELKLVKKGDFIKLPTEIILIEFYNSFPEKEDEMYIEGGICYWFFSDECPAAAVWVYKDNNGEYYFEWT